jgi:hypothetical protein
MPTSSRGMTEMHELTDRDFMGSVSEPPHTAPPGGGLQAARALLYAGAWNRRVVGPFDR